MSASALCNVVQKLDRVENDDDGCDPLFLRKRLDHSETLAVRRSVVGLDGGLEEQLGGSELRVLARGNRNHHEAFAGPVVELEPICSPTRLGTACEGHGRRGSQPCFRVGCDPHFVLARLVGDEGE